MPNASRHLQRESSLALGQRIDESAWIVHRPVNLQQLTGAAVFVEPGEIGRQHTKMVGLEVPVDRRIHGRECRLQHAIEIRRDDGANTAETRQPSDSQMCGIRIIAVEIPQDLEVTPAQQLRQHLRLIFRRQLFPLVPRKNEFGGIRGFGLAYRWYCARGQGIDDDPIHIAPRRQIGRRRHGRSRADEDDKATVLCGVKEFRDSVHCDSFADGDILAWRRKW